ncbi:MAG: deaminase [Actinobacteria bacterium]|nr:MAG: deaminase [Actinomycetota bacterium]
MGRIVISENVTLDGVVQDPTGEEGFRYGGWFVDVGKNDLEAFFKVALEEALRAEALLLGRRTFEIFAGRWPSRTGELADRMNAMPKYVVSSSLKDLDWNNSTVIDGDATTEVTKLKERLKGEIVVLGSRRLSHTLIENDLVDELRLTVYPFVLGAGELLFGETGDKVRLRLIGNRTVGDGLTYVTYNVVRAA